MLQEIMALEFLLDLLTYQQRMLGYHESITLPGIMYIILQDGGFTIKDPLCLCVM